MGVRQRNSQGEGVRKMDEKEQKITNETEYTVRELIEELIKDESWEQDPEYREKAVGMLMMSVFPSC